jgi:hypothetical protein
MEGIKQNCINCDNWLTNDSLSGHCQAASVEVTGAWTLTTAATATCPMFEPSEEAVREHMAGEAYWAELMRADRQRAGW